MAAGYLLDTNLISETRKIRADGCGASCLLAPVIDTLIAAITRGLTLVTRNTPDVAGTGVPLVDPWQSAP
jgi:predicted nucleic acid-binding protein